MVLIWKSLAPISAAVVSLAPISPASSAMTHKRQRILVGVRTVVVCDMTESPSSLSHLQSSIAGSKEIELTKCRPFGCTVPELVEGQGRLQAISIDVRSIVLLVARRANSLGMRLLIPWSRFRDSRLDDGCALHYNSP